MKIWHLSHGKDGYAVSLDEERWLPHHAEIWWEKFVDLIDHPCCSYRDREGTKATVWHRVYKHLPMTKHDRAMENFTDEQWDNHDMGPHSPREFIDWLGWITLNNKMFAWNHRTSKTIVRVPVDEDTAKVIQPDFVADCDDLDSDDEDESLTSDDS